eukprot:895615_1
MNHIHQTKIYRQMKQHHDPSVSCMYASERDSVTSFASIMNDTHSIRTNIMTELSETGRSSWNNYEAKSQLPKWIKQHSNFRDIDRKHNIKIDIIQYILTKNASKHTEKEQKIIIQYLQQTQFFKSFHWEILKHLIHLIRFIVIPANTNHNILYSESQPAHNIFILRDGHIELTSNSLPNASPTNYSNKCVERLRFSETSGVQRTWIQQIHRGMSFGSEELPSNFIHFVENNININTIETARQWTATSVTNDIKLLSININAMIETFHQMQLKKSNDIYSWLMGNHLLNLYLTKGAIDSIFECTSLKANKYRECIIKQGDRIEDVMLIINGRVQIEKTLKQQSADHKTSNITFVIDTIDREYSPFIGTEVIHKNKNYLFTARAVSKRVEYLLLSVDDLYLLFRSKHIRQSFVTRCVELNHLLYTETQKYYQKHSISTNTIGFPRSFSSRRLFNVDRSTMQRKVMIPNDSVCNIAPKKEIKRKMLKRCASVGTIKSGAELIQEIADYITSQKYMKHKIYTHINPFIAY